jgi:DNA-binding NarL/FixJ family response regulator
MGRMTQRVLIVDDDDLFAAFLRELLGADPRFEVVGRARNGREAIELVASLDPDAVTMDIDMPELDGVEATCRLLAEEPGRRVVMVSSSSVYAEAVERARRCGALGFVSKSRAGDRLADVLDAAACGAAFVAAA